MDSDPRTARLRPPLAGERRTFWGGYLFGVPVKDFGLLATGIIGIGTGFVAFFITTFLAIMAILIWNSGGHQADFAASYKLIGFPIGVVCALLALGYLGMLWVRRQVSRR